MKSLQWNVALATATGTSHERKGEACQDYHFVEFLGKHGEILVALASDGAGSASHSSVGSRLVCQSIMYQIKAYFDDKRKIEDISKKIISQWLESTANLLSQIALAEKITINQLACTLIGAIIIDNHSVFFQIGDGAIVIRTKMDPWMYIFWPQHGEYINTTYFITDPKSRSNFEYGTSNSEIQDIAIFTDGIEQLVLGYANQEVHQPFFNSIISPIRKSSNSGINYTLSKKLEQYLKSSTICDRTDDDKTLILASISSNIN